MSIGMTGAVTVPRVLPVTPPVAWVVAGAARVPPFASAIAWNAAWCSLTPSSVTHSNSLS